MVKPHRKGHPRLWGMYQILNPSRGRRKRNPVWGEWHTHCTLKNPSNNSSEGYVGDLSQGKISDPYPIRPHFPVAVKSIRPPPGRPILQILPTDVLLSCSRPEYILNSCHWTLNKQQSINQSINFCSIVQLFNGFFVLVHFSFRADDDI